jgi:hypothetical protein
VLIDDASERQALATPPPGVTVVGQQMMPTLVQQEIDSGTYRMRVTAASSCAWQVQQILNSTLSDEPPLKAAVLPSAPSLDVTLGSSGGDRHFHIETAGTYHVQFALTPCDSGSVELDRDGQLEPLNVGGSSAGAPGPAIVGPIGSDAPMFLGAGDWTVNTSTHCYWAIEITPWKGSLGGGSRGFAP